MIIIYPIEENNETRYTFTWGSESIKKCPMKILKYLLQSEMSFDTVSNALKFLDRKYPEFSKGFSPYYKSKVDGIYSMKGES